MTQNQYQTIVADPPWPFKDRLPGPKRGSASHYPLMTVGGIGAYLDKVGVADQIAPDARLFLWRVASMQREAQMILDAWGFALKAELVWVKQTSKGKLWFGMGHQVRNSHEICLIATKGHPPTLSRSVRSVFMAPNVRHSQKPEEFFDIVEQLSPGPYLELFPRDHQREGWTHIREVA